MKLELRHLAPYLPYKLKGRFKLKDVVNTYKDEVREKELNTDSATFFLLYCKPILRPLSDMIIDITSNGKTVVPMIEILKISEPYSAFTLDDIDRLRLKITHEHYSTSIGETDTYTAEYVIKTGNMGDLTHHFQYWEQLQRFSKRDVTRDVTLGTARQLEMFQKLFEYHFDVFGLIEQGLAIDINIM